MLIEKPYKDRLIIPLWAEGQSAKLSKIFRNGGCYNTTKSTCIRRVYRTWIGY